LKSAARAMRGHRRYHACCSVVDHHRRLESARVSEAYFQS
jgi:hypothetical protein